MVLFDISFLVSFFYVLPTLAGYFAQSIVISEATGTLLVLNIFSLGYILLVLLVYSFFKYGVLDFIKSLFMKTGFSFNRLGQFYFLNVMIFLPTFILFSGILGSIKEAYRPYAFIFLGIAVFLFLYVIINVSHSLFYQGSSAKASIKTGFSIAFSKIKIYREMILLMILSALVLALLFFGAGYLIGILASKNYSLYLSAYAYFNKVSIIIFDLAFYLVILINRISFYAVIRENKNIKNN